MVIFCVNDKEIKMDDTSTILDVKKEIMKQEGIAESYIDLSFIMDCPSRILGKFNIEPGKLARPFDRHTLDKFAFKDKVRVEYTLVDDYVAEKNKPILYKARERGLSHLNMDVANRPLSIFNHVATTQTLTLEPEYNLDSNDDFPTLT